MKKILVTGSAGFMIALREGLGKFAQGYKEYYK